MMSGPISELRSSHVKTYERPTNEERVYRSHLVVGRSGVPTAGLMIRVRQIVFAWIDSQSLYSIGKPYTAVNGTKFQESFTFVAEREGFRMEIVEVPRIVGATPIAFRLDMPAANGAVAHTVDIALRVLEGRVVLDTSVFVRRSASAISARSTQVPAFIVKIAEEVGLFDGEFDILPQPLMIADHHDFKMLQSLIEGEKRTLPIILESEPGPLDIFPLSRRLCGAAHVAHISSKLTFNLTALYTREWSLWDGAVRMYRSPFIPSQDSRQDHPLVLRSAIEQFFGPSGSGVVGYTEMIVERAFRAARTASERFEPFDVDGAREALSELKTLGTIPEPAKAAASSATAAAPIKTTRDITVAREDGPTVSREVVGTKPIVEPTLVSLRMELADARATIRRREEESGRTIEDLRRVNEQQEIDYFAILAELETMKERLATEIANAAGHVVAVDSIAEGVPSHLRPLALSLSDSLRAFQSAVKDATLMQAETDEAKRVAYTLRSGVPLAHTVANDERKARFPESLASATVEAWVKANHSGKLQLHKRALEALADSPHDTPADVYAALDLLANEYRAMRTRDPRETEALARWEERLASLHLRHSRSVLETSKNKFYDDYHVQYKGEDTFLEWHLRGGGSTSDPKRCLRIYFFWDAEDKVVVVGWLPSHLPNSKS